MNSINDKVEVCFVILHYKTLNDTFACVNSIKKNNLRYRIVIVDNHSNDKSYMVLKKKYEKNENIYILQIYTNVGFAAGNNIGYKFAKEQLEANYIIIMNNDTQIISRNLENVLNKDFKQGYAVIGPDILNLKNVHQNPMGESEISITEAKIKKIKYKLLLLVNRMNLYDSLVRAKKGLSYIARNVFVLSSPKKRKIVNENLVGTLVNNKLHGACVIYTPIFINREDYAFVPGTFFYLEEDLLLAYCKNRNYKTFYEKKIKIRHTEDSATNENFFDKKGKRNFLFTNLIGSLEVYIEFIKNKEGR
ncbi:MAG: glycosyltransferase [Liquorilactobacillus hordei]|uniref:glycosyltransferase n=1 Tax=Liquorilactobacillus hordei TaxID=468911 RepID=UPI0039E83CAB